MVQYLDKSDFENHNGSKTVLNIYKFIASALQLGSLPNVNFQTTALHEKGIQ